MEPEVPQLDAGLKALAEARHSDPFALLGRHREGSEEVIRTLLPEAREVLLEDTGEELQRIPESDLFQWQGAGGDLPPHYRLRWTDSEGRTHSFIDPYSFGPQLGDFDLHLFAEGRHWHAYRFLGSHIHEVDGIRGVLFSVWAPNAERVSVVGDFNQWDGRRHPMRAREGTGVWELFVPELEPGTLYKFELRARAGGPPFLKSDPYGRRFELRPGTATVVEPPVEYPWGDGAWMEDRGSWDWLHAPMTVYEVHLGSWMQAEDGGFLGYREIADRLVDYVTRMGFTHV
ncbi:MAG TPA: 1,4-alpha-glucan branching enzyme, partial [Gammaproteobacteria bacterium]|nr:1,4-alpha-glucan branching enzyme [Gammaproteobacteria bacterium]